MSPIHYWQRFSKKIREKLDRPRYVGSFTPQEAESKQMRYVEAKEQNLCFYWLVDESDGVIADIAYQVKGPIGLIAVAEVVSDLILRKNYDQVSRISASLIDRHVRDRKDTAAFPKECDPFLNLALSVIDHAVEKCLDIPFVATYDVTPLERDLGEASGAIAGWEELPHEQKVQIIEEVIDKEIRPYIELDAGGVKFVSLQNAEVTISYEGACTSCHASTGSTLSAIQQILKNRVHPSLFVTPQL